MQNTYDVSVVIPTVGRASLSAAIASVQAQTTGPCEVIVVFDGPPGEAPEASTWGDAGPCRVLTTGGSAGVAAARNLGLRAARGSFIAFLDDDDAWLPHHLQTTVGYLNAHPDVDVVATSALLRGAGHERSTPRQVYRAGRLIDFMFGSDVWRARERRIPTPTLVFRSQLADLPMDEQMPVMEDTWWLLMAEARGHKVRQLDTVSVVVNFEQRRDDQRWLAGGGALWLQRLRSLNQDAYVNYLVGTLMRTSARRGDAPATRDLARLVRSSAGWGSFRVRLLTGAFMVLASALRVVAQVRPRRA